MFSLFAKGGGGRHLYIPYQGKEATELKWIALWWVLEVME